MLLFLFSFTSFYLIRLCLHWFLPFQYTHSISLWPLFVSFTRSPLDFSLRALSHPVDPSTDDTAVTSKCLFLFRFSFFFYSYFPLAPHILTPCLVFGRNAFRCLFLYLMICSKSAYYPDPLSADEQRRERKKIVRTYQMELHVHMFVQKIAFSNLFLSFVIHEPKSDYLHSLSTLSLSHSLPSEPTLTHSI